MNRSKTPKFALARFNPKNVERNLFLTSEVATALKFGCSRKAMVPVTARIVPVFTRRLPAAYPAVVTDEASRCNHSL